MYGEKVVKTKKIAIIGFGAMGCRHAQSLINNSETASWEILAVETSEANFKLGLQKIGADETRVKRVESIIKLPDGVDMVIVATSSGPRFSIMNQLLDKGIRFYLLGENRFPVIGTIRSHHSTDAATGGWWLTAIL
jgi:D-arabinose 1-dehydrogenase-like Zn-dependent alcohol dehydrogenase